MECSQKLCATFWGFPVTNSPVLSLLKGKNISVPSAAVLLLDLRGHPPITYSEKRKICAPYYNLDTIPPSILSFSLFSCTLYKARKKDQIISKSKVYPRHPVKPGFVLLSVAALAICIFVITAAKAPFPQDIAAIRDALIGAEEVQVQMGMFTSEDGLSSSLTDAELEALAVQFDQKVDQYYAADIYCNEFYKWLNRDCLFRSHQTVVDNCIAGGVTQCDITGLVLSDNRTKATAKATVVTWNKWVTQEEDGGYTVSNPINRDALEVIMVKEDGIWKLSETLSLEKGMTGYDSSVLESTKKDHFDEENVEILEKIEDNKAVLSRTYDSFLAARNAVQQIDVETGNYIALLS